MFARFVCLFVCWVFVLVGRRQPLTADVLEVAVRLTDSEDADTKRWALKCVLKALRSTAELGNRVLRDAALIHKLIASCLQSNLLPLEEVAGAFASDMDRFFGVVRDYLSQQLEGEHQGLIFESLHPYLDNTDEIKEVHIPGAEALKIVFDPQSRTEANHDFVIFFERNPAEFGDQIGGENAITPKFSGGLDGGSKNFPTMERPLVVPGDRCFFKFHSDGSTNGWGWRFMATPCGKEEVVQKANHFAQHARDANAVIVETPSHPYEDNMDWYHDIRIPGAEAIAIAFDPRSSTEKNFDWVRILKSNPSADGDTNDYWGEAYSGGRDGSAKIFAGVDETPVLVLPADHCTVYFHSDGSNNVRVASWLRFLCFSWPVLTSYSLVEPWCGNNRQTGLGLQTGGVPLRQASAGAGCAAVTFGHPRCCGAAQRAPLPEQLRHAGAGAH